MAMYCLNMLTIALELAKEDSVYEDIATKFFEHYVYIGAAVNRMGGTEGGLWDTHDGFYYDLLKLPDGRCFKIDVQSIAGLIPLFATAISDQDGINAFRDFRERYRWFAKYRPDLLRGLADLTHSGVEHRIRLALVNSGKLEAILAKVLDEDGLLSAHGVRSVSRRHAANPFVLGLDGERFMLDYEPAESTSGIFGGNSNWRGPVWFPLNYLACEALDRFDHFLGDEATVEYPTGSGPQLTLGEVADDLRDRLVSLFVPDAEGRRPCNGGIDRLDTDPYWKDLVVFHEYFHGDTGAGLGASHQTGWTAIVADIIRRRRAPKQTLQERLAGDGTARPATD